MFTKQSLRSVCKGKQPRPQNVDKVIKIHLSFMVNFFVINNTIVYVCHAYLDECKLEMHRFFSEKVHNFFAKHFEVSQLDYISKFY